MARYQSRHALLDDVIRYARDTGLVGQVSRRLGQRYGAAGRFLGSILESMTSGRRRVNDRDIAQAAALLEEAGYTITPRGDVLHPPEQPALPVRPTAQPAGVSPPRTPIVTGKDDEWPEEHSISLVPRGYGDLIPRKAGEVRPGYPEIFTPGSSNVYSFRFSPESRTHGILYVTFLAWAPGRKDRSGRGPMYAYYDVPEKKYVEFVNSARSSAGKAVWDYLRVRGSDWQHQHQYRLVRGTIGANIMGPGQHMYVPRKATARGFRVRTVPVVQSGTGRARAGQRSQLPERLYRRR